MNIMSLAKVHDYLNLIQIWQPDVVFLYNDLCLYDDHKKGMIVGQGRTTPLGFIEHTCKV